MKDPRSSEVQSLLTTQEVADYLRVKERKIYDLVQRGDIPCSRVTGKWLFRKSLIDRWIDEHTDNDFAPQEQSPRPLVVGGSHDPLLEWAVRESDCGLATLFDGSSDGLSRFANGSVLCVGLHLYDAATGEFNVPAAKSKLARDPCVVLEWGWRQQGLIVAAGNPLGIGGLQDLASRRPRLVDRQEGSGSHGLLRALMNRAGVDASGLCPIVERARSEHDLALTVLGGRADVGFGVASAANQFGLDFVPIERERYDLLMLRRDYFEPPLQRLFEFTQHPRFLAKADSLGGYGIGAVGTVRYNAP